MEFNEKTFQEVYPNLYEYGHYFTLQKNIDEGKDFFYIPSFSKDSLDFLEKQIEKNDIFRYGHMLSKESLEEIENVILYFMIQHVTLPMMKDFFEKTKDINMDEFMKLNDDYHEIRSYLFPRLFHQHLSFYFLMNTMLKMKETISIQKVHSVLRVFNEYVTAMRNIQNPLPQEYHLIKMNELKEMDYLKEEIEYIQRWFLPTDLYKIWDEDYHPFYSIYELLDTKPMISGTRKEDFEEFMMESSKENNIYFTGSSIMYILLHGIDKKKVNDVDIWYNTDKIDDSTKTELEPVFIQRLFQKTLHSNDVNDYRVHSRTGILDIQRKDSVSLQLIHTYAYSAYMIIQTFDLPNVTAYFQIEDGKPVYAFTTHFMESILHNHIFDFYNYAFVRKHSDYLIDKRLDKYQKRGFTLSPKLMNRVLNYEKDDKIESLLESRSKKTTLKDFVIPYVYSRSFFQKHFHFDFLSYNSLTPELENYHQKYEPTTRKIIEYNNDLFVLMFMDKVVFQKKMFHFMNSWMEIGEYSESHRMRSHLYQRNDYFFKKLLMIDYETGEDVNPIHQKFEKFPTVEFFKKYNPQRMFFQKDRIIVNYPEDKMKTLVFNQENIRYQEKYFRKHKNHMKESNILCDIYEVKTFF